MTDKHEDKAEIFKNPEETFGLTDGEQVKNVLGELTGEVVVYDKDKDGQVTGWHKEVKNG